MPGTRKLGRATSHRTAMLRGLVTFLLENGKIETTVTRAKEVRALTETYTYDAIITHYKGTDYYKNKDNDATINKNFFN